MARRRYEPKATFSDMPKRLVDAETDEAKRERILWLKEAGLSFVDFISWLRSQLPDGGLQPPARRKLMTPAALRKLDERLEQEGPPRW